MESQPQTPNVDPALVPSRTLASGARMPAIGLGTFGSDHAPATSSRRPCGRDWLGYRHVDCAAVYGNEAEIGELLARAIRDGIARDDLWVTSKLWNDRHAPADVAPAFERSLRDLGLDHLDLYLVHWPFPNTHQPGVDVGSRDSNAKPYLHERYMDTWGELEKLVDRGLVRHIGTSNMTVPKLRLVLRDARIRPAANEMELHPHFQQPELFAFVRDRGSCPSASRRSARPPAPIAIAPPTTRSTSRTRSSSRRRRRLGVHPAVVCVKWAVQRGQVPIPFSTRRRNSRRTWRAAWASR